MRMSRKCNPRDGGERSLSGIESVPDGNEPNAARGLGTLPFYRTPAIVPIANANNSAATSRCTPAIVVFFSNLLPA